MKKNNFSRRDFIRISSAVTVPLTLGGFPLAVRALNPAEIYEPGNDKVMVLIQLQGGNDGLNNLYNLNQYSNLQAVRSNIIVPDNRLLMLDGLNGLHPAMTSMQQMWNNGNLGILNAVGYPNQNRSHFRSADIWHTASDSEEYLTTGWIGRMLDKDYSEYPAGYPNPEYPHPFALTIGKIVSENCQGAYSNYSLALEDPFNPGAVLVGTQGDIPEDCYGDVLSYVNQIVEQTNGYAQAITEAANLGNNLSTKYNEFGNSELSTKLKHVARLISGGLKTKVYVVQLGGFDTHDNQVDRNDTTLGAHANLLKELSDAIFAFQDDLQLLGVNHRVAGMTYSEFGRRIRSSASYGTDHGTANLMYVFGSCVNNTIHGNAPEIGTEVGIDDGVPMQFNFRNVYGTFLKNWLGAEVSEVQDLIYPDFEALPLFKTGCTALKSGSITTAASESRFGLSEVKVYPNPVKGTLNISINDENHEGIRMSLYNSVGQQMKNFIIPANTNLFQLNTNGLTKGIYYLKYNINNQSKSERISVL